jgi:hypothetical protein
MTFVDSWQQWGEQYGRAFDGTMRVVEHMTVDVSGWQYSDGRVGWSIRVYSHEQSNDADMSAAQARQVAAALLDAADQLDRLTQTTGTHRR